MSYSTYGGHIRQSTAITVALGPFMDATDGFTAETALTITQPDIRLSKNGAAFAQKNAAQTLSHMENGFYSLSLDATDTNTVGSLIVHCAESGTRPHTFHFDVLEEEIYDGIYASTAGSSTWLPANIEAILGTAAVSTGTAGTLDVNVAQINTVTGVAQILRRWLGATGLGLLTVDSGTTTTIVDAALTGGAGSYVGGIVHVYSGTNAGMSFRITAFNAGTDTLTLYPAAPSAFDATSLYVIVPDAAAVEAVAVTDTGVNERFARIQSDVDTGLRVHIDDLDTGLHAHISDVDTGLHAILALADTGRIATAVWAGDTGLRDHIVNVDTGLTNRLNIIASDVDTGLRAQISDVDTGLHDALADYDTGLRALLGAGVSIADTGTLDAIAWAILNKQAVDGRKVVEALRLLTSILGGQVSGAGTGTEVFSGTSSSTPRVTATVDSAGNRTAITYALDT